MFDGWSNIAAGLNTKMHDARMASRVRWNRLPERDIEELYAGDSLAAKVVDLVVDDATKEGYEWVGISESNKTKLKERLAELYFDQTITEAAKKARLYGGAAILKAYNDDLNLQSRVTKDSPKQFKSLVVFQRFEIPAYWQDVDKDILSTEFKNPIFYTYTARSGAETTEIDVNVKIHYSRLVRFDGAWLPDQLKQQNNYWGDSVLSRPYDAIRNYSFAHDSVNAALKDLSVGVYKMNGLADQIAANCDDQVIKRFSIINLTKSIARAVVLDAEGEDFEYRTRSLQGSAELVDKAENRVSSETSIPRTVLLGESPKGGLGQTGEHQEKIWYDAVHSYQENDLKPNMLEIAKEVCIELGIDESKLDIEFAPLWQLSAKEDAEAKKAQAEVDRLYLQEGVVDPIEIRESRFGGDKYSAETTLDPTVTPEDLKPMPVLPMEPSEPNSNPDSNDLK